MKTTLKICKQKLKLSKEVLDKYNKLLSGKVDFEKEGIKRNQLIKNYKIRFNEKIEASVVFYAGESNVYMEVHFLKDDETILIHDDFFDNVKQNFSCVDVDVDEGEEVEYVLEIEEGDAPFLLVLEGGEASGKSTVAKKLIKKLESMDKKVVYTREPGGVPTAEKIRDLILEDQEDGSQLDGETEAYLFAAARSEHIKKKVKPLLEKHTSVIMDRYFYSSLAYQGVGRDIGFDKVYDINKIIIEDTYPDLTIYLKISPEERKKRLGIRGMINRLDKESEEFTNRVEKGYEKCKQFPEFIEIDANGSVDEVINLCLDEMKKRNLI